MFSNLLALPLLRGPQIQLHLRCLHRDELGDRRESDRNETFLIAAAAAPAPLAPLTLTLKSLEQYC